MSELLEGGQAIGHLFRRAGFEVDPDTLAVLGDLPYERLVRRLVADLRAPVPPDPPGFDPYVPGAIQELWLQRMVSGVAPLAEKLAFFWHGHFATSNTKVEDPALMWQQYRMLRGASGGKLSDLVLAVSRDVAMIRWLDGNANRRGHPNENYARELQELFTLGIGHYTETDIREIARAFTGWGSRHHDFVFFPEHHDSGDKTIHGVTAPFGGEEVAHLLTGLPACHRFIAAKLLAAFSHPQPTAAEVDALAAVLTAAGGDIATTLLHLFLSPDFRARARHRVLVKSPVELCAGALRALGMTAVPPWIHGALDRMGQILFQPPSVKGWTSGLGWLSAAGIVERLRLAERLAAEAPDSAAETLASVAFEGIVPEPVAAALHDSHGRELIALVLGSPEFQLA